MACYQLLSILAVHMGGNSDSNGACAEVNDQMRGDNARAVSWLVTGHLEKEDYNELNFALFKVKLLCQK